MRKALFDILRGRFAPGSRFLDLYAGSGAVGLEAASQGFVVSMVEADAKAAATIRAAVRKSKLNVQVFAEPVEDFISRTDQDFDVIFLDPPYQHDLAEAFNQVLRSGRLNPGGLTIIQHPRTQVFPFGELRIYGSNAFTLVEG
jgi:16S rRNA (guanine(966)-N(2))-methyltransferase RsmD